VRNWMLGGGIALAGLTLLFKDPIEMGVQAVTDSPAFTKWDGLIKQKAAAYKIPWRWMKVIILNESSNGQNKRVLAGLADPKDVEGSKSSDGKSWGLFQITLPTAKALMKREVTPIELNNPDLSAELCAKLLKELIGRYGLDFEKVMRDYNGGPNANNPLKVNYALTTPYLLKSKTNLAIVMAKQPGNELE